MEELEGRTSDMWYIVVIIVSWVRASEREEFVASRVKEWRGGIEEGNRGCCEGGHMYHCVHQNSDRTLVLGNVGPILTSTGIRRRREV